MDRARTWTAVCQRLREELGWVRTGWLEGMELRTCEPAGALLEAADAEGRAQAEARRADIEAAFEAVLGKRIPVRVGASRRRTRVASDGEAEEPEEALSIGADQPNETLQLGSFLVGPMTEIPLRFAREVVDAPGRWNPVTFHGGSGSGKTHLLHGIANGFRRRYPGRRIVCASSEKFARQFSLLARRRQAGRFRDLYRHADLLILDDLQDLAGKPMTERELTITLDHLHSSGKQVVLASAAPPKRIAHLERSLEDRLTGGLVVELKSPDRLTKEAIIRARCAAGSLTLEPAIVELLCSGLDASVRDILCALTQLEAHRRHVGTTLDLTTARAVLAGLLSRTAEPATLDGLCEFVALRLDVPAELLKNGSKRPVAARARLLAMALARELTPLTLREVGSFFGQRSCGSVHAAKQRAAELRAEDPRLQEVWEAACARFVRPTN